MAEPQTDFIKIEVIDTSQRPDLDWVRGMEFTIPRRVLQQSGHFHLLRKQTSVGLMKGVPALNLAEAQRLRLQAAFIRRPPLSTHLQGHYRLVPVLIRDFIAHGKGRWLRRRLVGNGQFPSWPLDLSADFLADLANEPNPFRNGPAPVVLSHDIDTLEGLQNLVQLFLPREEKVGARSVNFIVPCSWPLDFGLMDEVVHRGHEIGIHGYDHGNLTPFVDPSQRLRRLAAGQNLIRLYHIKGYRAPSLLRTPELLRDLREFFLYDSSIPTSGGIFPVLNNGCASARPFRIDGIWEFPLSMPTDSNLWFQGFGPEEIFQVWKKCAHQIARSGGVVVILTHCERRFSGSEPLGGVYERFLNYLAAHSDFTYSSPVDLLNRLSLSCSTSED